MKFKAGDKVQYKGDDETYKIVKIAEQGEVVKGPWCDTEREFEVPEKAYIIEGSDGEWYYHEVEKEKYYELITEETPPKFKVGDTVRLRNENESFKIIKIAEKGEIVDGPWWDEDENVEFKIPEKAYILEDEEKEWYYYEVSSEERLNLVTEETPPKFKVGDTVRDQEGDLYKVIKIAEAGETVEGPWFAGYDFVEILEKSYILENAEGTWGYQRFKHDKYLELVTEKELIEHLKQQREEKLVEQLLGSRETTKRLERELEELRRQKLKFKVGDIIRHKEGETLKVIKIAEEGEEIRGPWWDKHNEEAINIPFKTYILEDKFGWWLYIGVEKEKYYELITKEVLTKELKDNIKKLDEQFIEEIKRFEIMESAPLPTFTGV
jgi:uncharacterized protein YodC (DUF2158 family)